MGRLLEILAILRRLDAVKLDSALAAAKVLLDDGSEPRERVAAGLALAAIGADFTETEADDQIVDAVTVLADSDEVWLLIDAVIDLLDRDGEVLAGAETPSGNVPWSVLIPVILEVLKLIRERRNA